MEGTRQRRDCTIHLRDAINGDLPPVCAWCGEATNNIGKISRYYGLIPIVLRLPLCEEHKKQWRWHTHTLTASLFGFVLFVLGIIPLVGNEEPDLIAEFDFDTVVEVGLALVGMTSFLGFLCLYLVLLARGIQIKQMDEVDITLKNIAPEFVGILQIYNQEKCSVDQSPRFMEALHVYGQENLLADPNVMPSDEVLQVLEIAAQEARRFPHEYLGTEHLLLGFCTSTNSTTEILQRLSIEPARIREEIVKATAAMSTTASSGKLFYTPGIQRTIEHGVALAQSQKSELVTACHLLLGLLQEQDSQAVQILHALGIDLEELHKRVQELPEMAVCKGKSSTAVLNRTGTST